jgi:hypothetical protein
MKFVSGLPFTECERAQCLARKSRAQKRQQHQAHARRKATPSGQDYARIPTKAELRIARRIVGERDDSLAER